MTRPSIPKDFCDIPRAVTIVNNQAISTSFEFAMGAKHRFRRRPLKESPRLGVYRGPQKIVRGGVPDVELDSGIKFDEFHQIRRTEGPLLVWRLGFERLCAQLLHRLQRRDMEADLLRNAGLQQNKKTAKANAELEQRLHRHLYNYTHRAECTKRNLDFWRRRKMELRSVTISHRGGNGQD
jgi:hypothetical protein